MISLLVALALAQAEPAPAAASPSAAPPPSARDVTPPAAANDGDTPKGAPDDDYDFVAWCHGALTGHMALYTVVKPELKSIERPDEVAGDEKADREQMEAGKEYLALYARALHAAGKAHAKEMTARREKFEAEGAAIWDPAKGAEPRTRMWSWLLWDLPGRCEVAAKRLQGRSGVLGAALKTRTEPAAAAAPADGPKSIDDVIGQSPVAQSPAAQPPAAPAPAVPAPAVDPSTAPPLSGPH